MNSNIVKKFGHLHLVYHFTVPLNKKVGLGGMWTLPGPLSEKLNFIFVINFKKNFFRGSKTTKLHFGTKFYIFRSTWDYKKKHVEHFFQFLMFNISSIKELLHKPSEIQWNITGTLPGKLKRKISLALSYKILPLEITRTWEIAILGGTLGGPGNQCGIQWFCHDFVNFWKFQSILLVKNSVSRRYHQKKTCYIQIIIVPDNTDAKKTRKTFHKLRIRFFLMLNCKFFIITSIYGSKLL